MYAIRPSAAWIWGVGGCRGYAAMCAKYPEIPGLVNDTVREEGTAGHWVAHMMGKGYIVPEGSITPNKIEVDAEMLEGAELYLNLLRSWGTPVYQEMQLPAPWIHERCGGTPDAWSWCAATRTLRIPDYKYGYRYVDEFENPALTIYASAVLDYLHKTGVIDFYSEGGADINVELIIIQPRSFSAEPIRTWAVKFEALRPLLNQLHQAAIEVMASEPNLKAGEHCNDCQARHSCPAAQRTAEIGFDVSAKMVPNDLTPVAMGDMLRRLKRAKEFLASMESGLETQLLHAIANGHIDPNWAIGHGRSSTVYKDGCEEQLIALAGVMKIDALKPRRAKTPKQLEALIDPRLLERYTEVRPGRRKLVPFTERTVRKLLK